MFLKKLFEELIRFDLFGTSNRFWLWRRRKIPKVFRILLMKHPSMDVIKKECGGGGRREIVK